MKRLAALALILSLSGALWGQTPEQTQQEILKRLEEIQKQLLLLRQEQVRLRNEVEALRRQGAGAQQPQAPGFKGKTVSLDDDPFLGSPEAPLTLVEFSDYQ